MLSIPEALPDETLFSRFVRYLTQTGMRRDQFLYNLFGKSRLRIHPFLTIGASNTVNDIESAKTVIREQTLESLFSHYLPQQAQEIQIALLLNKSEQAIHLCRISNFSVQGGLNAKYCALCSNDDVERFGFPYWHLTHQIPGLYCCHKHLVELRSLSLPETGHISGDFLPPVRELSGTCNREEAAFSRFVVERFKVIQQHDKPHQHKQFLGLLEQAGYVTKSGRYKRKGLLMDVCELIIKFCDAGKHMFPKNPEDFGYISPLLTGDRNQHPFKYLLLEYLLREKLNSRHSVGNHVGITQSTVIDSIREDCIDLLNQNFSLAEISRQSGKSRTYLKLLAAQEGIPINLSPKILTKDVKDKITQIAKLGFHRKAIAKAFNISDGSVEQIISSVDGLVEHRKKCRYESKRRRYKVEILRATSSNPLASREDIKQSHYAAFHWLYRNERDWLEGSLPSPQKPKQNPRVDWHKRDKELFTELQKIMRVTDGNLSNYKLDKLVGGHGWLTRRLDKLPKTKMLISAERNKEIKVAK